MQVLLFNCMEARDPQILLPKLASISCLVQIFPFHLLFFLKVSPLSENLLLFYETPTFRLEITN